MDLIYSNDPDLVSSVSAEPWPIFTGHKLVTASVSYRLGSETKPVEKHLLDCGRRLKEPSVVPADPIGIHTDEFACVQWPIHPDPTTEHRPHSNIQQTGQLLEVRCGAPTQWPGPDEPATARMHINHLIYPMVGLSFYNHRT